MSSYSRQSFQDIVIPGSIAFAGEQDNEPVSLAEAKVFMHIGYDEDNDQITRMLKSAREWVEKITGCSLIERTVSCRIELCDSLELPYGPVKDITLPDGLTKDPGPFTVVKGYGYFDCEYTAGYTVVPESLKLAILERTAALYENRGDTDASNHSKIARSTLFPFIRFAQWG